MNTNKKFRTAVFYKDYFEQFFVKQNNRVKEKIIWTIRLVEDIEVVPSIYLKSISGTNGIYEIRIQTGSDILFFWQREYYCDWKWISKENSKDSQKWNYQVK